MNLIRMLPTLSPGMLTRRQIVSLYAKKTGIAIDNFAWYYGFGLFPPGGHHPADLLPILPRANKRINGFAMLGSAVGVLEKGGVESDGNRKIFDPLSKSSTFLRVSSQKLR